jgi:hypothetical protein
MQCKIKNNNIKQMFVEARAAGFGTTYIEVSFLVSSLFIHFQPSLNLGGISHQTTGSADLVIPT